MDNSNNNKADDGHGDNLHLLLQQQQRRRQSSNLKAPEERPYRRRIKPPPAKVHHVHPARFRRFVQRRTCRLMLPQRDAPPCGSNPNDNDATSSSTRSATTTSLLQPIGDSSGPASDDTGCLGVARKSMQEAYMAWCSSNDIPLSPGTMAELSFTITEQPSNDQL